MKNVFRLLIALLAFSALVTGQPAFAAVTASLDRNQIAPDETVRLLLQRDGSGSSQPDISVLKRDFDILGSSSGSSVQIINGHINSRTQVSLTLAPKHNGTIQIPPLQWEGEQSAALELTVGVGGKAKEPGTQTPAPAQSAHVFLTSTLNRKQSYVQAVVVLTVRLYTDKPLYQASLDLPANSDILVTQLGKDVQTDESRNGHTYQVIERKYLLFPQRSGRLSIDGAVLDAQIPDDSARDPFSDDEFFGNVFGRLPVPRMVRSTRPLRVRAEPVELNVLPRPAAATGANWLPAQAVTLTESGLPEKPSIHVGEPITRHLHLSARGLTGAQLPDLGASMPVSDGIKAYPDQAKIDDQAQGDTVLGSRDQDIALIASRPGHFALPALKLTWWDSVNNVQREAVLPEHDLDILPAAAGSSGSATPSTVKPAAESTLPLPVPLERQRDTSVAAMALPTTGLPWPWISLGLGLIWLATLAAWWYSHRREPRSALANESVAAAKTPTALSSSQAFKAFQTACRSNDPQAARAHLLAWASTVWPEHPALGLNAISRLLNDPKISEPLRQLDRACYVGNEWHGEALAQLFAEPTRRGVNVESKTTIPALYP